MRALGLHEDHVSLHIFIVTYMMLFTMVLLHWGLGSLCCIFGHGITCP